jgi:hypothetical protein
MYGPAYGFGPPPSNNSSPFNHPHQPQQQQQGQQQPQQMMYYPQAYGAAPQQPSYDMSAAAAMAGSPESMAMTPHQDSGMAHLPGGGMFALISCYLAVLYSAIYVLYPLPTLSAWNSLHKSLHSDKVVLSMRLRRSASFPMSPSAKAIPPTYN